MCAAKFYYFEQCLYVLTVYLLLWWKAYLEPPEGIPFRVNLRATQQTARAPNVLDNSSMFPKAHPTSFCAPYSESLRAVSRN